MLHQNQNRILGKPLMQLETTYVTKIQIVKQKMATRITDKVW